VLSSVDEERTILIFLCFWCPWKRTTNPRIYQSNRIWTRK